MPINNKTLWLAASLIVISVFSRVLPHPDNFTAVTAAALFGGAFFGRSIISAVLPLLSLYASDLVLNNTLYSTGTWQWGYAGMGYVYGAMAAAGLVGACLLKPNSGVGRVAGATVLGTLFFWLVSNLGVWQGSGMYAHTTDGLVQCYLMALPFLRNALFADLLFAQALFGIYHLVATRQLKLNPKNI